MLVYSCKNLQFVNCFLDEYTLMNDDDKQRHAEYQQSLAVAEGRRVAIWKTQANDQFSREHRTGPILKRTVIDANNVMPPIRLSHRVIEFHMPHTHHNVTDTHGVSPSPSNSISWDHRNVANLFSHADNMDNVVRNCGYKVWRRYVLVLAFETFVLPVKTVLCYR